MFDYTRNESYAAGLHLRLKRNVRCDSLNCGSRHCGSKKLLASRLSYKFAISPCIPYTYICILYIYIYTFIYICMYKNIMCKGYRACPWIYIYIYKWKGWRRKSGHAEIFFRAFPLQVGGCERTNYRTYTMMHVCKTLEDACYNYESV